MKITRQKAIEYLIKEAELNIIHHNHSRDLWDEKISQLEILPDWYLKMFWYETYTEKIEIVNI